MEITGYKYDTESDAINARTQCASFYGLPKTSESVTQYWVNYEEANSDTPIFWYITFDESVRSILGDPSTFEVTPPPMP